MKIKIYGLLIIMIITIFLINIDSFAAFGEGFGFNFSPDAEKEIGETAYVPPPEPEDAPGATIEPEKPKNEKKIVRAPIHRSISGNAYEDLGLLFHGSNLFADNREELNKTAKKLIQGITVQLLKDNNVIASQVTGENGSYEFKDLTPGTYSTRFIYGDINSRGDATVEQVLKYNGHDYITVYAPERQEYLSTTRMEISNSGKGAAVVYLVVDVSSSMYNKEMVNGQERRKIDVSIDAAKSLVNKLLDSGENIYIGLVLFNGTAWNPVQAQKNKTNLNRALDELLSKEAAEGSVYDTDIIAAFDKAKESFDKNYYSGITKEETNKFIIFLSDAIPNKAGGTKAAAGDPNFAYKMNKEILPKTQIKLREMRQEEGIKILSLFIKSELEDVNELREIVFGDTEVHDMYRSMDEQDIEYVVTEEVKKYLKENLDKKEYSDKYTVLAGYEEQARREEVNKNFSGIFYNNPYISNNEVRTRLFKQIEKYDNEEDAKTLSEMSYMTVIGGQNYSIESPDPLKLQYGGKSGWTTVAEYNDIEYDENGNPKNGYRRTISRKYDEKGDNETWRELIYNDYEEYVEYRDYARVSDYSGVHIGGFEGGWERVDYTGQNIILRQKPAMNTTIGVTATGLRLTLSDGTALKTEIKENDSFLTVEALTEKFGGSSGLKREISEEVVHGATLEVEYTIGITSSIQCQYLELLEYLPRGLSYAEDSKLITKEGTNKDLNFENILDLADEDLCEDDNGRGYITKEAYERYKDRTAIRVKLDNNGQKENGFYISPGMIYEVKVVASRIVDRLSDFELLNGTGEDEEAGINAVEVIGYRNDENRRMMKKDGKESITDGDTQYEIDVLTALYPGDVKDIGYDYTKILSNSISVIPPTGKKNYMPLILSIVALLTVIVIIILILLKRHYKKINKNTEK